MVPNYENRIFVFAPFGKDGVHLTKVLSAENFLCISVNTMDELLDKMREGVGMILTTEEILASKEAEKLTFYLQTQPTWSAIPIIAFYSENRGQPHPSVDVTFLQRPVSRTTLLSTVNTVLRDRARQYKIRDLLNELQQDIQAKEAIKAAAIEASLAKSQFLANMSHEIRTPLGAILGFLDLMKDPSATVNDTSEYISVIERNSRHLTRLIDDILDLSKVEAGKMEIERFPFSLAELLIDFSSLMKFKAQEKGILFDLELATPVPAKIISDQVRLRQVLTNAVGNAIKFTNRGRVQLVCRFEDGQLTFTVTDTGKGMTSEQSEKLFRPFIQADSSTTRQFGGTGLGLILTKMICEQMGGTFRLVSSEPAVGSTFEASIEIETVAGSPLLGSTNLVKSSDQLKNTNSKLLEKMKILLVEDSPDNQALIRIMLKKLGTTIDVASDGKEGVSKALAGDYNAVLMDVQMPYMDGHEATRKLRKEGVKVPIIALTAHAMNEERDRAVASGFSDFLTKPIDRERLVQTLLKYAPESTG